MDSRISQQSFLKNQIYNELIIADKEGCKDDSPACSLMIHPGYPHVKTHCSHSGESPFHFSRPQSPTRLAFAILDLRLRELTFTWILTIAGKIAADFSKNGNIKFTFVRCGRFFGLISLPGACNGRVARLVLLTSDF
jgi:hypothetical protein